MNRLALALPLALGFSAANTAHAQTDPPGYEEPAPSWVGHFTVLSANTLVSGVTAGLFQELRGGSFKDGFTRGALGGAMIYAGKRVAVDRFFGAGLIGRELAAVGASVVRNASDNVGTFDRLILPVGFVRVYWRPHTHQFQLKLDVLSAGFVAYAIVEDELHFEVANSLSSGTAVFRTDNKIIKYPGVGDTHAAGLSTAGIITRADVPAWGEDFLDRALAHERVHVLQDDQVFITLSDQADDWLMSKLGPIAPTSRYIDVNVATGVFFLLEHLIPNHADRPWEMEPLFLTR